MPPLLHSLVPVLHLADSDAVLIQPLLEIQLQCLELTARVKYDAFFALMAIGDLACIVELQVISVEDVAIVLRLRFVDGREALKILTQRFNLLAHAFQVLVDALELLALRIEIMSTNVRRHVATQICTLHIYFS